MATTHSRFNINLLSTKGHTLEHIKMSSINSNDDDEYLNYDKDLNQQNMTTNNVIQGIITNIDNKNDDDTMETIMITQNPEYNESSRMMIMLTDGFGFVDSKKRKTTAI